jgi:hypothetical protein
LKEKNEPIMTRASKITSGLNGLFMVTRPNAMWL